MEDVPRLAPLTDEELAAGDEETRGRVELFGGLNIFRTLARHPDLMRRWLVFGNHVLSKTTLADRDRELVILRAGWRCGSEYEFGQHRIIAAGVGVTTDEIRRLARPGLEGWAPADAVLVSAVDELLADRDLTDETWAALERDRTTEQIIDLVFTVGQYALVSTALRTFRVPLEEGTPGFPT